MTNYRRHQLSTKFGTRSTAILDVEHRISLIALREDDLSVLVVPSGRLSVDPFEQT